MPDIQDMTPGEVLAEASVAEFIKALGLSIAEPTTGQYAFTKCEHINRGQKLVYDL